jgi:hypothetical protein
MYYAQTLQTHGSGDHPMWTTIRHMRPELAM